MFKLTEDLNNVVTEYPGLKIRAQGKTASLEGTLTLIDEDTGLPVDTFDVSISFPQHFPFCFPKVTETSKKIPREQNRHTNPDDTLCLAPTPEEILFCRHGITTNCFIKTVLMPRLAEEHLINDHNGQYLHEFSHGTDGLWEYYFKKLDTTNENLTLNLLKTLAWSNVERQTNLCPCNSGKKFKKCHSTITSELMFLPTIFIEDQIQLLLKNKYKNV